VLEAGIEHRDAPKEHVEEIMYERLLAQVPKLEQLLAPLAVCASAAPLLGLLGTVTGMIHTFRLITVFGTGDARMLSSGISEALITTEVGLIIAVPALLVHAFLSRRVRKTVADARQASIMFVNGLKLVQARDPEVGP
jgi:biopolymer transport protein ExbB